MSGRSTGIGVAATLALLAVAWLLVRDVGAPLPEADPAGRDGSGATPSVDDSAPDAARAGAKLAGGPKPGPSSARDDVVTGPRLTGRVVDQKGAGIGGARLLSLPDSNTKMFALADVGQDGVPAREATADADGRFRVAVDGSSPFYAVFARAAGYAPALSEPAPAGGDVTVVLERPGAVAGTVSAVDGSPIAGARVRVLGFLDAVRLEFEANTDSAGAYRIEGLPPRTKRSSIQTVTACFEEVTAAGYAPLFRETSFWAFESGKTTTHDIVLTTGATLAGKVVDDAEAAVGGARVALASVEGMSGYGRGTTGTNLSNPWSPRLLGETVTARDGTFLFERIPSQGRNAVSSSSGGRRGVNLGYVAVWKEGSALATEEVPVPKDGETTEVVLKLSPAAIVVGRVLEGGAPAAGATVSAIVEGASRGAWFPQSLLPDLPFAWATADADGRYRIPGVRSAATPSKATLSAYALAGAARKDRSSRAKADVPIEVTGGRTTTAPDLVLETGATQKAVVRVLDPAGNPVWGATVGQGPAWMGGSRTDRDGRCTMTVDGTGSAQVSFTRTYIARALGFAPVAVSVTPTPEGVEVEARLGPAHRVSGVVLDAGRKPRGATVNVLRGDVPVDDVMPPSASRFAMASPKQGMPVLSVFATVQSQEDGTFTAEDLPEGPYNLVATASPRVGGMGGKSLRAVVARVPTDATGVEVLLPLDDSPPTGVVEGSLVDAATGKPLSGFTVTLNRGSTVGAIATDRRDGWVANAQSEGSVPSPGRFSLPTVPVGTWTLDVDATGRAPVRIRGVEVVAGETRTVPPISVGIGAVLVGTARTVDGSSLKGHSLSVYPFAFGGDGPRAYGSATLGADGSFRIPGLLPGSYHVVCTPVESSDSPTPLLPADGEPLAIPPEAADVRADVLLAPGAVLRLSVDDPRLPSPSWAARVATDEQKSFGEKCLLAIRRADGRVVASQRGLSAGYAGMLGRTSLLPGRYVVHAEFPGDPPRDVPVTIEVGKPANVTLSPK